MTEWMSLSTITRKGKLVAFLEYDKTLAGLTCKNKEGIYAAPSSGITRILPLHNTKQRPFHSTRTVQYFFYIHYDPNVLLGPEDRKIK